MKASALAPLSALQLICRLHHLPEPVEEYRFLKTRRFRFDAAWPAEKVALEINGGVWTQGRHVRGKGYLRDLEKLNLAQLEGWVVLQCTPQSLHEMGDMLKQALS